MITSGQIKAGRALVNWTARHLAEKAEIGFSTLIRLESSDGVPAGNIKTLDSIKKALQDAGIEFIGTPEDGPGVRLRK